MRRARLALQRLTSLTITPSRHPQKKDAQVAYIMTPDAAVHSIYGFYMNHRSRQFFQFSVYPSFLTFVLGAQKNRLNEYSQHMFCLRNKKIIFCNTLLTKDLQPYQHNELQ